MWGTGYKGDFEMNILLDLDGVLSYFVLGFTQEAVTLGYLEKPFGTSCQPTWEFGNCLTILQQMEIWNIIENDPWWWANLSALVDNRSFETINNFQLLNQVVFCTNRRGPKVQLQTKYWLANNGIVNPAVVVTKRKGEVAKALDIDYSLDDQVHNANCIHWMADMRPCRSYLLDQPYNKEGRIKGVRVVRNVTEFLTAVKEGE